MTRGRLSSSAGVATVALVCAVAGVALSVGAPALTGLHPRLVVSTALEPQLRPGDIVLTLPVVPAHERRIAAGDLVVVASDDVEGATLLLRVTGRSAGGTLHTNAPANRFGRSRAVVPERVLARTVAVVPLVGRPYLELREGRPGPAAATVLGGLLLLGLAVLAMGRGQRLRASQTNRPPATRP